MKNTKGILTLNYADVKLFLHYTFNFTPLDDEIKEFSGREENSELNWEETQEILANLRENLKSTSDKSKNYSSYQKFYDDMYKHKRKEISPNDTFKSPVTYGQNYGFYKFRERDLNDIRYPKVKCEETKYAESIIMTGKQFMK